MRQFGQLLLDERTAVPRLVLPAWIDIPWLRHGWSTRLGGVSAGAQSSLNFSSAVDSKEHVERNLAGWRQALAITGWDDAFPSQVHGVDVAVVTGPGVVTRTDGLVTVAEQLALHVVVADCLPILLLCRRPRAVGAVHAGWRGTVGAIVQQAVSRMVNQFGVAPADLEACIGPGIGPSAYLVDEPVLAAVRRLPVAWPAAVKASAIAGQAYLDLPLLNKLLLQAAGLRSEQIHLSGICTHDDATHFFSHRRDQGQTGRLIASIGLAKESEAGFAATKREVGQEQSGDGDEANG